MMTRKDHSPSFKKKISDKGPLPKSSVQVTLSVAIFILLLTFLVYTPALENDFVNWDDPLYIGKNIHIRSLNLKSLHWMFTTFHAGFWIPLTWFSHALDYALWGLNPTMHHLTNNILHALNSMLLFFLVVKLLLRVKVDSLVPPSRITLKVLEHPLLIGGITALLFALHPLRVESVVWMTERKDLLSAFFVLFSLLFYLSYTSSDRQKHRRLWFLISLSSFILALMSKPMAVSLPAILLLLDLYPLKRLGHYPRKNLSVLLEKIPFLVSSLTICVVTIMAKHSIGALRNLEAVPLTSRLVNGCRVLIFYLEKMVWPFTLVPFYPLTKTINFLDMQYLVSGILVFVISGWCVWMVKRKSSLWLIAWAYYVVGLLPTLGIIQVGRQAAADRFTYLPGISLFLLSGIGIAWSWEKAALFSHKKVLRGLLMVCIGAVLLLLSYRTTQQIKVWQNSEILWNYVINNFPKSVPTAYLNLGSAHIIKGRLDEAIAAYKKALVINPNFADAHTNLGIAYGRKGRLDEAIHEYKKALAINPNSANAHSNLGTAYGAKGLFDEAIAEFKHSLALNPNNAKAYYNLGAAYEEKGLLDNAISDYKKALAINPYYAKAHYRLGSALKTRGKLKEAISAYHKVIRIEQDNHEVYNELAWIYATSPDGKIRNGAKAVALATKACELTGFKKAEVLDTLAAAYAEQGNFEKAIDYQERAIKLSPPQIENELQKHLQHYKLRRAYREH